MWSKNIITEAAVDVVWDVSGGGGSTSAIVYTVKMSHDPQMTSAFCLPCSILDFAIDPFCDSFLNKYDVCIIILQSLSFFKILSRTLSNLDI